MNPGDFDLRQYEYSFFDFTTPDTALHSIGPDVTKAPRPTGWLITRIQLFAATNSPLVLVLNSQGPTTSPNVSVAAGGCLELQPRGLYRGGVLVQTSGGAGGLIVIEYLFAPATADGTTGGVIPPNIIAT